jgi:hypothetical protein
LPIPFKFGFPPIKSLRVTTGKAVENWIVFPLLLAVNVWFYAGHYNTVVNFFHHLG